MSSFVYNTIRINNRLDVLSNGKLITNNKGDILVDDGTKTSALSVGTNGHALIANSSTSEGIEWRALVASDVTDFDTEVSNNSSVAANISHVGANSGVHGITGNIVGTTDTQTLTNKTVTDNTFLIQDNSDNTKKLQFELSGITTSTTRTLTVPDNNITLVGTDNTQTLSNKTLTLPKINDSSTDNVYNLAVNELTTDRTITLPLLTDNDTFVFEAHSQTLTNKTINADNNSISNIDNTNIKSGAAIDASKIANGTISNTEFQYLNGLSSTAVGISDTQTLTNKTFTDNSFYLQDDGDNSKKVQFDLSNITTSTIRTLTVPDSTSTLVGTNTTQTLTNKTFGDDLNLNSNKITNLATPIGGTDAVNKDYVDNVAAGLDVKESVKLASKVDLDSNSSISGSITYNSTTGNNSRGQIVATLGVSDIFTMDGDNLSSSDNGARLLLKDQIIAAQNGIWILNISGTVLTLDRASDFDADNKVTSGAFTFIEEGTQGDCGFVLSTDNPIIVGGVSGTALIFTQFSGTGQITAGTGMTKSGNILNVIGSTTIIANADSLEVNSSDTSNQVLLSSGTEGTTSTFGALPLGNSNSITGILSITNGGTNASSFGAGSRIIATNSGNSALETTSLDPSNIVTLSGMETLTNKTFNDDTFYIQDNGDSTKKLQFQLSGITTGNTRTLTIPDITDTIVGLTATQTITNKTINADNNTITNIDNNEIKAGAAIDATKIADGTISNVEFQYLDGIGSSVVGISDTQTLTNKTFTDNLTYFQDNLDTSKKLQFQLSNITTSNTRVLTVPDANGTIVCLTIAQTLTNKTIDADSNIITNIDNADIKSGAAIDASKIADGSISNTEFQYLDGISSSVVGISDTQTLTNKTLTSAKIDTGLNDTNGNEVIKITAIGSAVNEITIINAATGNGPTISATGNDTNIDLNLTPKGSGNIILDGHKWPTSDGSSDQVLKTDGAGNISFANAAVLNIDTITTTDATITTISTISTSNDTVYLVESRIVARRTDAGTEGATFCIKGSFRNDGGTLTKLGDDLKYSPDTTNWTVVINTSGTDIIVQVTGEASKTVNWKGGYRSTTVS